MLALIIMIHHYSILNQIVSALHTSFYFDNDVINTQKQKASEQSCITLTRFPPVQLVASHPCASCSCGMDFSKTHKPSLLTGLQADLVYTEGQDHTQYLITQVWSGRKSCQQITFFMIQILLKFCLQLGNTRQRQEDT